MVSEGSKDSKILLGKSQMVELGPYQRKQDRAVAVWLSLRYGTGTKGFYNWRPDIDEVLQHPAWGPLLPKSSQVKRRRLV